MGNVGKPLQGRKSGNNRSTVSVTASRTEKCNQNNNTLRQRPNTQTSMFSNIHGTCSHSCAVLF